jgi:hypothetical protein
VVKPLSNAALTRIATKLREAHLKADQANAKFNARTDELNAKMDRQPRSYPDWMARRAFIVQDVERRDYLDDYQYWRGEEARIADMIQAEKNLRDMGISHQD